MATDFTPHTTGNESCYGMALAADINNPYAHDLAGQAIFDGQRFEIPAAPVAEFLQRTQSVPSPATTLLLYPENYTTDPLVVQPIRSAVPIKVTEFGLSYAPSASSELALDIDTAAIMRGDRLEIPLRHLGSLLCYGALPSESLLIAYPDEKYLRVNRPIADNFIRFAGNIGVLYEDAHIITLNDEVVPFTLKEFQVISMLAKSLDKFVTRHRLHNEIWGTKVNHISNLDVRIGNVRQRFDSVYPGMGSRKTGAIVTARNVGYRLLSNWPPAEK